MAPEKTGEKPEKKKLDLGEKAKELGDKIGGFFKPKDKHADYPVSEPFEGPMDDTHRASELDGEPITTHVALYHPGRSDEAPLHEDEPAVEADKRRPAARLRIRYEFRPQLVRLGVLPAGGDRLARRERARGFDDFCPEPRR